MFDAFVMEGSFQAPESMSNNRSTEEEALRQSLLELHPHR